MAIAVFLALMTWIKSGQDYLWHEHEVQSLASIMETECVVEHSDEAAITLLTLSGWTVERFCHQVSETKARLSIDSGHLVTAQ